MVDPVPPADHVIVPSVQPVAVSIAFSVPQIVVLFALIVGAAGDAFVPIVIELLAPDVPQLVVHVAV